MNVEKIDKLEEVLALGENKTIVDYNIERLTAAGENYGSLMLKVDVIVESPEGDEEIPTVAKLVPPNEFLQKVFDTQTTFKNEIGFYSSVVPTLHEFQREQGMDELIDFFPKYYGSRINLSGDPDKVDSDAVLLLENLKVKGFVNLDRTEGFDLEAAKLVINDLALLHAVPLALKLKKPDIFEENIKKYLYDATRLNMKSEEIGALVSSAIDKLEEIRIYKSRVMKAFEGYGQKKQVVRETFATFSHNDCWVNNIMVKFQGEKPVDSKLVDFQVCEYGSPAKDLIFFLFTSVRNHVLEKHTDSLIQYYHEKFTSFLKQLKCETSRFSFNAFMKEIDFEAKDIEFTHIIYMTFPIFAPKGAVKELSDLVPEDMLEIWNEMTDAHKQKFIYVVKEFAKRNWI